MHPLESFLRAVREIRDSGAGVAETSYYPAISALLNEAGSALRPAVGCIINLTDRGAGIPDGGFFTPDQVVRGAEGDVVRGQLPARGALEVKGLSADAARVAESDQVTRYLERYGQVLVTNLRDWVLVGRDDAGAPEILESFRLAPGESAFLELLAHPRAAAERLGEHFFDFLRRVLIRPAPLTDPEELAWVLASYAREARTRAEAEDLPALAALREALEDALGMKFHGTRGEHFFRSTLVQTLFYGVFSGWVLWHREGGEGRFQWRMAAWTLRVPAIRALFHQIADPEKLFRLGLVEPLDWAEHALNRVDRGAFFKRFQEEHAVQYFYEPFLEAFDPALRKEMGVWYTPPEVVKYMVARVDTALKEELGIADGLADPRVLVLDPCCGTGAYLVEVLEHIARSLAARGEDALLAEELKRAATERVFGFEILPAPFVVAHLQLGLTLQRHGALGEMDPDARRVGVFLTNALTGWGPPADDQKTFAFPELKAEHDAAEAVKRSENVLVVLGNPPYNGYPGAAIDEERGLVEAYRSTRLAPKPQGRGLNDLYVRFFRMAERRIVEMSGKGVVCFISNYSWLDGLSFTGMRERYLEAFDGIWIDSLNGDKYRTGKLPPDGKPDPSIFSTEWNREGIQVGTAIATLVKREGNEGERALFFRNLWGRAKRVALLDSVQLGSESEYQKLRPSMDLGFPFTPRGTDATYLRWRAIPDLFARHFPGVQTSRDDLVIDTERDRLVLRLQNYFDPRVSHEKMRRMVPRAMESTSGFDAEHVREYLQARGLLLNNFIRFVYRPFDVRWLYWEPEMKLLDRNRAEFREHVFAANRWFELRRSHAKELFDRGYVGAHLPDTFGSGGSSFFPLLLAPDAHPTDLFAAPPSDAPRPNLSDLAQGYLAELGAEPEALFHHVVAILHAPDYRAENAGALRQDWPRVPLPATVVTLDASAVLGRELATLLDPERLAPGVTAGEVRPELRPIGAPGRAGGGQLDPDAGDFRVTAGWGHAGKGGATMPGRGRAVERDYTDEERGALEEGAALLEMAPEQLFALLGERCVDVWLNDVACWRCVPVRVWEYTLGGYQVMKKWLSYREEPLLGRALRLEEVREVSGMARRIAAILLLEPALDEVYAAAKGAAWGWSREAEAS